MPSMQKTTWPGRATPSEIWRTSAPYRPVSVLRFRSRRGDTRFSQYLIWAAVTIGQSRHSTSSEQGDKRAVVSSIWRLGRRAAHDRQQRGRKQKPGYLVLRFPIGLFCGIRNAHASQALEKPVVSRSELIRPHPKALGSCVIVFVLGQISQHP